MKAIITIHDYKPGNANEAKNFQFIQNVCLFLEKFYAVKADIRYDLKPVATSWPFVETNIYNMRMKIVIRDYDRSDPLQAAAYSFLLTIMSYTSKVFHPISQEVYTV